MLSNTYYLTVNPALALTPGEQYNSLSQCNHECGVYIYNHFHSKRGHTTLHMDNSYEPSRWASLEQHFRQQHSCRWNNNGWSGK